MSEKKILIIEDAENIQSLFKKTLEKSGIVVIQAFNQRDAWIHFRHNMDIPVILVDYEVPEHAGQIGDPKGSRPNTLDLIRRIRGVSQGTIIAMPGLSENRQRMIDAGSNLALEKADALYKALEILNARA